VGLAVLFFGQLHYLPKLGRRQFGGLLLAGHAQPTDIHEVQSSARELVMRCAGLLLRDGLRLAVSG